MCCPVPADPGSARNAIAGMDGFNRWGGAIVVRLAGTGAQLQRG